MCDILDMNLFEDLNHSTAKQWRKTKKFGNQP